MHAANVIGYGHLGDGIALKHFCSSVRRQVAETNS